MSSKRMPSNKRRAKDGTICDRCLSKRIGNDGYYYECVICDLGGNLLCCDCCPCTYHLGCLNPPLKDFPTGKWLCPSCQKSDQFSFDLISKHSRTEIFTSKVEMRMTGSGQLCPTISKRKSSSKTEIVCKSHSNTKVLDSYQKVWSGPVICSEEKKPNSPMKDLSGGLTSDSSAREISSSRIAIFIPNEATENNPDLHCGPVSSDIGLDSRKSSPNKRKREEKTHIESRRHKSRSFSGKYVKNIPKRKKPTVNSFSSSKNKVRQMVENNQVAYDYVRKCSIMNEVDRILGCRAIVDSKSSLCDIYLNEPNDCSGGVLVPHNENNLKDEKCGHGMDFDESGKNHVRFPTISRCCGKGGLVEHVKDFVITSANGLACIENVNDNSADSFSEKMVAKEKMNDCLPCFDRRVGPEKYRSYKNDQEDENVEAKHKKCAEEVNMNCGLDKLSRSDNKKACYEFLIKWTGKSHLHNSWISEGEVKVLAKRKLENYKLKYGQAQMNNCDEQWKLPQRVIALRSVEDGSPEAFIKWTGLSYDECTWEKLDEPAIVKSVHLIDAFNQFERQALGKDAPALDVRPIDDCRRGDIATLKAQPMYLKGSSLFPHQLVALNWLRTCWNKSKNVILADEMGLGKTVSACAFLSSIYFEFNTNLPSMVLVPLSTMPNWLSEFSLWSPNLNVVEYHGCARARSIIRQYEWHPSNGDGPKKAVHYKFNVLLTTYEMVLADSSHLHGVPWEVLLVDEGHRLKNSGSKLFSLLNTFCFHHRVLLTGTPLQNNIGEMYNLLNFLQPASFPSLSSFEEKFIDLTIAEKIEELKRHVAPHMLRRLKKDAMPNIPPKVERMVPVELSSIQAEFYRAMLTKNYQVLRNIGRGLPHQSMLNIVMQLRKVCNHPYLIPGTEPDSGSLEFLHEMRIKASAKLTILHSMLKVLYKEGHKVLVFSQMTKLLDILEDYLAVEYGPKTYERVDGSVSVGDRQAAIARFNQDKSRFVFLLSTRSCGLGINLATADTVIIYDSDFNPHADIQAMNRAHRIGQSSRLLVYRLVVRASVEERILQLARKKLMLDQLFVNKSGSQKDVEDILKWGTEQLFDVPGMEKNIRGNCVSNDDALTNMEYKHKKRTSGLGDVYNDTCTDNSSRIVWNESAILKLLDRSSMQFGGSDTAQADSENDMLGSLKFIEWNDEPSNEQTQNESSPLVSDNLTSQISEKKDHDFVAGTQENDWDRLLRVRWEKYQNEEEAVLGRGKRLRKVVSYKEDYAPRTSETVSEISMKQIEEQERDAADEQKREYTVAGRAFKIKFAKLRARQKERLSQQHMGSHLEERPEPDSMSQLPSSKMGDHQPTPSVKTGKVEVPTPVKQNGYSIQRAVYDHIEDSGFREKMELPELSFDGKLPPIHAPPIHAQYTSTANSKILPYMSLQKKSGPAKGSFTALPTMPFISSSLFPFHANPLYNLYSDVDHAAGLGYRIASGSPFPENHQQVLDDLITRMRSGSSSMFKRRVSTVWSDAELDSLWVGVRRHGRGNWDSMLRDPRLKFSCYKTSVDLGMKWEVEELKVLDGSNVNAPESSQQLNSVRFSPFPGTSGERMERAFRSLSFGDYPHFEASEKFMPLPQWNPDKRWSGNFRDSSVGPFIDVAVSPNYCMGSSLLLNSKNVTEVSSDGMNHLKQKEVQDDGICRTLPILDGSQVSRAAGCSGACSENNLPHWLRDAVGAPSNALNPVLPTSMSAITHTFDLCGDGRAIFPPFGGFGYPWSSDPHPTLRRPIHESSSRNRCGGGVFSSPTVSVPAAIPELANSQSMDVVRDVNTGASGSGNSSGTLSDHSRTTLSKVHEISSEETII